MRKTLDALVNPFGNLKSESPQQIQKHKPVALDKKVERAYQKYMKIPCDKNTINPKTYAKETYAKIENLGAEILTPSQIELLLQKITKEATPARVLNRLTGFYLSYMIQTSYNMHHNNFTLTTGDTAITELMHDISGTKEKPINLKILGDVTYFGVCSSNVHAEIAGSAGWYLGMESQNSKFNVTGSVGCFCGIDSKFGNFTINGNVAMDLALDSEDSTYVVEGKIANIGSMPAPRKCMFMTHNPETYAFLRQVIQGRGNKVILLK